MRFHENQVLVRPSYLRGDLTVHFYFLNNFFGKQREREKEIHVKYSMTPLKKQQHGRGKSSLARHA